ncbi:MAG: sorbosone dehydrogenase family protein [Planctomycetota bacterium]
MSHRHSPAARALCALSAAVICVADATAQQVPLKKTLVASGLERPVWIGSPPGDRDRLFVIEQRVGRVRILAPNLLPQPFLDLGGAANLAQGGEQGLLGLAFHPAYAQNGRFFVYYVRAGDGAVVLARYQVSATDPDVADPNSEVVLLTQSQPQPWHNGGAMHFGRDGMLYVAVGDGGGGSGCQSQQLDTLLGKILRLDVDTGAPYAVPADNPFVAAPNARGEIWHHGLRNPWRFCFEPRTGAMLIADVGSSTREELSIAAPRSSGLNFGWGTMEGLVCMGPCSGTTCNGPELQLPVHEYVTGSADGCAIVGGLVYRGCAMPQLRGRYFFGDLCSARVWSAWTDGYRILDLQSHSADLNPAGEVSMTSLSTFGEDGRGELYVANITGGRIFRIEPEQPSGVTDLGGGTVGGDGTVPAWDLCGPLALGSENEAVLRRAPAGTLCALLISNASNPVTLPFGTILVDPVLAVRYGLADAVGELRFDFVGLPGPWTIYSQWVLLDPGATGGLSISNALRVDYPAVERDLPRR